MKELIKISTNEKGQQLVSARELHEFLGSRRQFSDWIKQRIEKYDFIENVDFTLVGGFSQICEKGGRPSKEYVLTIEMAKELAMVENNEKGKQARRYFIECEKKLVEVTKPVIPQTMSEALLLAYNLQLKIEQDAHKVEFANQLEVSEDCIEIGIMAKLLSQNGVKIGRNRLYEDLRDKGILIVSGESKNLPKQEYIERGYFEIKEYPYIGNDGKERINQKTMVTVKGQQWLLRKYLNGDFDERDN